MRNRPKILFEIANHPATVMVIGVFWLIIAALQEDMFWDEARWAYAAREWVHYGAPLYRGVIENKPPGIILLFAFSDLLFGPQYWFPRLVGILCIAGTAFTLYQIGNIWKDRSIGLMAMAIFLLANASRLFNGNHPATTESFINFFAVLAFYWVFSLHANELDRFKSLAIAGFFMGCAIAFKQIAITSAVALFLVAIQSEKLNRNSISRWWTVLILSSGIIFATWISVIPSWLSGVTFREYVEGSWLLLFNSGDFGKYPGSGARWPLHLHNFAHSLTRLDTMASVGCFFYLLKNRKTIEDQKIPIVGLIAWLICDTMGVHASGYYFGHQFKQLLPSLSLAIGLSVRQFFAELPIQKARLKDLCMLGTTWIVIGLMIASPRMPVLSQAWGRLRHQTPSPAQLLGQWVSTNTQSADYIYATEEPGDLVLYYSGRQSASPHYNTYYIDSKAVPITTLDLTVRHPPRYIILWNNHTPDWLERLIAKSFDYRFNRAGYWIYERTHEG